MELETVALDRIQKSEQEEGGKVGVGGHGLSVQKSIMTSLAQTRDGWHFSVDALAAEHRGLGIRISDRQ